MNKTYFILGLFNWIVAGYFAFTYRYEWLGLICLPFIILGSYWLLLSLVQVSSPNAQKSADELRRIK